MRKHTAKFNDQVERKFIFMKTFGLQGLSAPDRGCMWPLFLNIFSKTFRPIKAKFYMELPWKVKEGTKVYINGRSQMIKKATKPICGKSL